MHQLILGHLLKQQGLKNYPDWLDSIKVKHEPMDHQRHMISLYLHNFRYMDAGDPGTGKTLPSHVHGIVMASVGNKVVYTMPPKLIEQFHEEMLDWFPGVDEHLDIVRLDVPGRKKQQLIEEWNAAKWPDILMMSYDGYRTLNDVSKKKRVASNQRYDEQGNRVDEKFTGPQFSRDGRSVDRKGYASNPNHRLLTYKGYNVFFFDEAHALCGIDSIISKSVHASLEDGECAIYLMTGTPIPSTITDAYGLIRLINPQAYTSQKSFLRQHVITRPMMVTGKSGPRTIRVPHDYINTKKIHHELFRYGRRIQKQEVVRLEEPLIQDVKVHLSGKHAALYKKFMRDHFAIVGDTVLSPDSQQEARHMSLKLISCPTVFDPQMPMKNDLWDRFKGLMDEINPMERKVVVFAYNRATVEFLVEQAQQLGWNPACIYGGSQGGQEKKFKEDDSCRVIIMNWVSGGAGLNLQNSSYVVFYEIPNATHAKQGIARVNRKGQTETVSVYFMRVMGTLSDKSFQKMLSNEEQNNEAIQDEQDLLYEILGAKK